MLILKIKWTKLKARYNPLDERIELFKKVVEYFYQVIYSYQKTF